MVKFEDKAHQAQLEGLREALRYSREQGYMDHLRGRWTFTASGHHRKLWTATYADSFSFEGPYEEVRTRLRSWGKAEDRDMVRDVVSSRRHAREALREAQAEFDRAERACKVVSEALKQRKSAEA